MLGTTKLPTSRVRAALVLGVATLALAACGDKKGGDAPAGQVVAQVAGEDVTIHELNAEIQGSQFPPTVTRKQAEQQALQNIITRRLLLNVAKERKLDQNPQFLMQERRGREVMLVQTLARDVAQKVTPVSREDAQKFMRGYPNLFESRKFFILDQIQFLRPKNIEALNLPAAKTMAEVEQALISGNVEYRRQPASLDAVSANPDFINEITKLLERNPKEVFMFANQPPGAPAPVILVNQVTEARTIPFTGERAIAFAQNLLQQTRVQAALQQEVRAVREKGKATITYQAGYTPPPPPPKTAPKAAAGGAPTPPTPAQVADRAAMATGGADLPTGTPPPAAK